MSGNLEGVKSRKQIENWKMYSDSFAHNFPGMRWEISKPQGAF